jgi:outer membrane murein-binding lipoprotein Lpp
MWWAIGLVALIVAGCVVEWRLRRLEAEAQEMAERVEDMARGMQRLEAEADRGGIDTATL